MKFDEGVGGSSNDLSLNRRERQRVNDLRASVGVSFTTTSGTSKIVSGDYSRISHKQFTTFPKCPLTKKQDRQVAFNNRPFDFDVPPGRF